MVRDGVHVPSRGALADPTPSHVMTQPEGSSVRTFDYRGCRMVLQATHDVEYPTRFRASWVILRDETRIAEGATIGTFATASLALASAESLASTEVDTMLPRHRGDSTHRRLE